MATPVNHNKRKFSNVSTVTLLVGPEKTPFLVHKDQLCEVAPFFKAAFTSNFKESSEEKMELPEDDIDSVDLFIQWLYKQPCEDFMTRERGKEDDEDYLLIPAKFLIFADKYDIQDCKRYIVEAFLAEVEGSPNPSVPEKMAVKYMYQHTSRGSGLRSLLVDCYAYVAHSSWLSKSRQQNWLLELPEFAIDLLIALAKFTEQDRARYPFETKESEEYMRSHTVPESETNSEETIL